MLVSYLSRRLRAHPVAHRWARSLWHAMRGLPLARSFGAPFATLRMRAAVARERRNTIAGWLASGRPAPPPPAVKQSLVAGYGRRFGLDRLVETGTYRGEMVVAQRGRFRQIWSIELDDRLYAEAAARFRGDRHVTILHGDSASVLPQLLQGIREPCLFWLDGHYSGGVTARGESDTPVVRELAAILGHPVAGHVVLIDDARMFGSGDYPTAEAVREQVNSAHPDWSVAVRDDVIRAHGTRPPRRRWRLDSLRGL
jgi:hypothetical protein